jgi:hypothetical protein
MRYPHLRLFFKAHTGHFERTVKTQTMPGVSSFLLFLMRPPRPDKGISQQRPWPAKYGVEQGAGMGVLHYSISSIHL